MAARGTGISHTWAGRWGDEQNWTKEGTAPPSPRKNQ